MRFLPLVWAAIMRKRARAVLTLLAMIAAFTLVGLMTGMNAGFQAIEAMTRSDRIFVNPRFFGLVPAAIGKQIAGMPGVAAVVPVGEVWGYYQERRNNVYIALADLERSRPDWPVTPAQWLLLRQDPDAMIMSRIQADRWHKKVGDVFTMKAPSFNRMDGTKTWRFKVVAIAPDTVLNPDGYLFGNLTYFDKSKPLSEQGQVGYFEVMVSDPERGAEIARAIDDRYASSGTPTRSFTDRAGFENGQANGVNVAKVTRDVSLAGLVMILFLTANGISQSVRERFAEFAALKTIGYGDAIILLLVFLEAAIPCVIGAAIGIGLAALLSGMVNHLLPPGWGLPMPVMTLPVYLFAAAGAAVIALASTALPALKLSRMDIATALSGRT
jgi:putative ABC transport system permease protein